VTRNDPDHCRIAVTGDELVELKRHAHQIPECPGLDHRIQRHKGKGPLVMSKEELDWVIAVLDAVLSDRKGYSWVEYEPLEIKYVPHTDERRQTCYRLYERLEQESERMDRESKKKRRRTPQQRLQMQIERSFSKLGFSRAVRPMSWGYAVFNDDDVPVALIRRHKERWEVLLWTRREKWEPIGDLGVSFETVQDAAGYVVDDPLGIFWR
jgi:hypothetical protein